MTETLTSSNLYNSFAVFREILQSISAFTVLYKKAGVYPFTTDERYVEDEPNQKSITFTSTPFIWIDTDVDDEAVCMKNLKRFPMSTIVTIYSDYFIEKDSNLINSYLNAIVDYFNSNQDTLLSTYGINAIHISKSRDRDVISEKQFILGMLTFDYEVLLDVEN